MDTIKLNVASVSEIITNNAVFCSPIVSSSSSSYSVSSRSSLISKGASLAPQEIRMDFAVFPETSCQGLFIKKISNSIICCTMLVVYVIWLYN